MDKPEKNESWINNIAGLNNKENKEMLSAALTLYSMQFERNERGNEEEVNKAGENRSEKKPRYVRDKKHDITDTAEETDGEEEEEEEEEEEPNKKRKTRKKKQARSEPKQEDDSDETLTLLLGFNLPDIPPATFFDREDVMGECSRPFWKQLTTSDLNARLCKLTFTKKYVLETLFPLLEDSEKPRVDSGTQVSVFGEDGKVHEMMFKLWAHGKMYVLSGGWKEFYLRYKFQKHCDFVMCWMFRHKTTRKICFAITSRRFAVQEKLSSRISKQVFK